VFVFAVAFSFAVAAGDARPLSIPSAGVVERIVIGAGPGETFIKDRAVIERFLAFLTRHNDRWRQPWDTFPTPQWTIRLETKDQLALVLWVGPTWLGGRAGTAGAPANQLRDLSRAEYAEMLKILGLAGN